jgi:hypothetical protein
METSNDGHKTSPMLPGSIFLFLVHHVTRVIFICLVPNVTLSVFLCEREKRVTLGTRQRKIDTGNIGHRTQKDRHE